GGKALRIRNQPGRYTQRASGALVKRGRRSVNANPNNPTRAFWRSNWRLWAWRVVAALLVTQALWQLLHAKSFAGAAYYGGLALLLASAGLNGPLYLNRTIPQIYQLSRAGTLVQVQAARVLGAVGLGLLLLSVYFWLSSG